MGLQLAYHSLVNGGKAIHLMNHQWNKIYYLKSRGIRYMGLSENKERHLECMYRHFSAHYKKNFHIYEQFKGFSAAFLPDI